MKKSILASVLLTLSLVACSQNALYISGGATDSPNASVTARVIRSDGTPAAGSTVILRQSDYVTQPPSSLHKSAINNANTVTDAQGQFELIGVDSGTYDIEVFDSGSALLLRARLPGAIP